MKKIINSVIKHPLISGSTIIFVGSMAANIVNYVFNVGAGRLLSYSDYGTFISLISIFNIFSVFSTTINTVFTKFTAALVGQKKEDSIGQLFITGSWWIGIIGLIISGLIIIASSRISNFLNINSTILVNIISFSLFFSYLSFVGNGILQGLLKFTYYSFINIASSLEKLVLGGIFILIGLKVFGAISAFFSSVLVGYVLIFFPLYKFLKKGKSKKLSIPNLKSKLYRYSLPVFLSNIGITAFITIDIILVKHFFNNPDIAAQYAAISTMGRSIFFAVSPIGLVFFPLVAQKNERGENLTNIVLLSLFLVALPSIILSIIYFIFPEIVRVIFYPTYQSKFINPHLGPFSIFILFYALIYILNLFYLSIGKIKVCMFTILGALFEIILIWFYHKDITQIINNLIISSFLLMLALLLYYPIAIKKNNS